ncbi:MAG: threonine--tRNA ligase [Candidatus Omnitrophica bacterium 4484_70.1]|nr:MAG: threonine--tRNA ligase [Candidatus Omnitrophica bacterium 4484_70.1]
MYPQAKLGIGPATEEGFYYDFDAPLKEEDLPQIERIMKEIIEKDYSFIKEEWSKEEARKFFKEEGEIYKLELIEEIKEEKVSIYKHADFIDLCKGPHVNSTGEVRYFKLLSIAGAYWRGKESNPQLKRIYGTAFFTQEELDEFLKKLEEAKKRDHRILGRRLRLFEIYHLEAGAGLVFYLPRGAILRRIIEDWLIEEHLKRGYKLVVTPHIMDKKLWEKSGHLDFYKEYMYPIKKENQEFILKPMNCPGHILIYQSQVRSWRQLPLRIFELGTVYRYEKSGVLCGLLRVRGFTQDDAHIFCKEEDLYSEIEGVLEFIGVALKKFGFQEFSAELSTRPDEFIGDPQKWDEAEKILEEALKKKDIPYKINPKEGAFYGPKIDIKLKDALGRSWQCATLQLDYSIPERFDITYQDKNGQHKRVVMLHRVILGSIERFIATLVEHFGGRFPLWLAPVQIKILTVKSNIKDYSFKIKEILEKENFRVEMDLREETLSRKIREAETEKAPYILILGEKEMSEGTVSVRRENKDLGKIEIEGFIQRLKEEI